MIIGVHSLRLNSDIDVKHLLSYARSYQYDGDTTEKADLE